MQHHTTCAVQCTAHRDNLCALRFLLFANCMHEFDDVIMLARKNSGTSSLSERTVRH